MRMTAIIVCTYNPIVHNRTHAIGFLSQVPFKRPISFPNIRSCICRARGIASYHRGSQQTCKIISLSVKLVAASLQEWLLSHFPLPCAKFIVTFLPLTLQPVPLLCLVAFLFFSFFKHMQVFKYRTK